MSREALVKLALRWMALWQGQDRGDFDALHDAAFVDHAPAGRAADRAAFRAGIEELYCAFPDFLARVEDVLVDDELQSVAIRWTAKGTHRGEFMGHQPTGRCVDFAGIEIIRCANGKIIERWGEWDGLALEAKLKAPG